MSDHTPDSDPAPTRRRGRLERRSDELAELGGTDAIAVSLKERVYATFTGLAVVLLALAAFGVLGLDTALRAASTVYIATLGLVGWVAVRRSRIAWWQQLLALAILMALGLAVVGLQILAHSA